MDLQDNISKNFKKSKHGSRKTFILSHAPNHCCICPEVQCTSLSAKLFCLLKRINNSHCFEPKIRKFLVVSILVFVRFIFYYSKRLVYNVVGKFTFHIKKFFLFKYVHNSNIKLREELLNIRNC